MSEPRVRVAWSVAIDWELDMSTAEWKTLVEEMDSNLPTDVSDSSVAEVKQFMRSEPQLAEEVLSALEDRRDACCMDSTLDLESARVVAS